MSELSSDKPEAALLPDLLRQQRRWLIVLATLFCVVVAGLFAHFWLERQEVARLREEMARRLQTGDTVSTEVRGIAQSMQDTVLDLQAKVTALENRQVESQSQQTSLEQMYRELAKTRDDRVLTDIEQILLVANQQLQLSDNVHGALIALENADKLLAREDRSQFISVRRALAKDIESLRAVPHVDVTGMALKLDVVIDQVRTLPLLSDAKIQHAPDSGEVKEAADTPAKGDAAQAAPEQSWWSSASRSWRRWAGEFWGEMRSLVQVRNVKTPDALILSPTQAYFLRENLMLRLLSARVAMMTRDHVLFSGDMKAVMYMIETYFDPAAPQVQAAKVTLLQIKDGNVAVEMPSLSESLTAVQNYRTKP